MVTARGERIGLGDRFATRRNDPDLGVGNRQTWTVTGIDVGDSGLILRGHGRDWVVAADYATRFVELAYATTVHGAQGETVDRAHVAIGDTTGAAAAYVAMTRGRNGNTAHLVAESVEEARRQWAGVFARDRADLGPAHAERQAIEAVDRYGSQKRRRPVEEPRRPIQASGGGIGI
jgi:exodeoxyribonuclease V alpha subunit